MDMAQTQSLWPFKVNGHDAPPEDATRSDLGFAVHGLSWPVHGHTPVHGDTADMPMNCQ